MVQQIFLTSSIAANTTSDVTPTQIRTSPEARLLQAVGISGATVNTLVLNIRIGGQQITNNGIPNGVTRTSGAPIDQASDVFPLEYLIEPNSVVELLVSNTTAGALTAYIYYDILDDSDV